MLGISGYTYTATKLSKGDSFFANGILVGNEDIRKIQAFIQQNK